MANQKAMPITEETPTNPKKIRMGKSKLMMEKNHEMVRQRLWNEICCFALFLMLQEQKDASIGEDHTPETHIVPIIFTSGIGPTSRAKVFLGMIMIHQMARAFEIMFILKT